MKREKKPDLRKIKRSYVRQQDQSDCGVACLAALIKYFGGDISLEKLREESGTTQTGTTLLGLYQAAPKFGLVAGAYEADIPNLMKQNDPCILHIVKENYLQHYVICYGYDGESFMISDPAEGVMKWSVEELKSVWESKALMLIRKGSEFVSRKNRNREKWKWIRQLADEDLPILGVATSIGLFIAILGLSTAIFTQKLIDEFLPDEDTLKLIAGLVLLTLLLLARNGLSWIRQLFLIRQSRDFNNRMIRSFYSSLLRLPIPFFHNRKTGDLIARLNDTRRLQSTITFLIGDVIIDLLLIVVAAAFVMYYSVSLGFFILGSMPVYLLLTWMFHSPILEGQKEVMKAHALNESNYVDTIQGIAVIKENNREPFFSDITKQIYGHFQNTIFDLGKIGIRFSFWADSINVLFIIGVLGWGSLMVLNGELLIGALVAVIQMSGQMIPATNRLALTNLQLQEARVAFDRMFEFTSLEPEYKLNGQKNSRNNRPFTFDSLEIENITFRFPGRSQLLNSVSLSVKKGEMAGILGESGCGKTTILHILKRFHEYESGEIIVNESKLMNHIPIPDWRSCISSVPQEIKMFNASLLQNICLHELNNQSEIEKVISFCRKAGMNSFFESFPQGYMTLLGEEGVNISGGQNQLVALARALYQKPQLLLLDEPTSAMDRETEQKVLKILNRFKEEMAIILVSHRVQSIKYADRIYILENGELKNSGSPRSLMKSDNLFFRAVMDLHF